MKKRKKKTLIKYRKNIMQREKLHYYNYKKLLFWKIITSKVLLMKMFHFLKYQKSLNLGARKYHSLKYKKFFRGGFFNFV